MRLRIRSSWLKTPEVSIPKTISVDKHPVLRRTRRQLQAVEFFSTIWYFVELPVRRNFGKIALLWVRQIKRDRLNLSIA